MTILITGGEGFIGSHMVSFLKKLGHKVVLFKGDISKKESFDKFDYSYKIDAAIHLASIINKRDKNLYKKVNVYGTENFVEFCQKAKIGRLIFLSSIRVLSPLNDPYSDSKREAENIIINSNLPYIILRPSIVYGPGDNKNVSFLLKVVKLIPFIPLLNFQLQPIFVGDMIKIISVCLNSPVNAIFDVVSPETITFKNLLKNLKLLNYKFYIIPMPSLFYFIIRSFSFLPFFPMAPWQIRNLFSREIFSSCSWQEKFNIEPTSFLNGIAATVKYKKHNEDNNTQ